MSEATLERTPSPAAPRRLSHRDATSDALGALMADTGRDAVVIGLSKDPNAKLTAILLPRDGRGDAVVAKIATTARADAAVEREHDTLVALWPNLVTAVQRTVPEPLALLDVAGRAVLVLTATPGTPLSSLYQRRRHTARRASVATDFVAVDRWLGGFQDRHGNATGSPPLVPTTSFLARFGDDEIVDALLPVIEGAADRLDGGACPARPVHGDLWAGNLLLSGGAVTGVVDWESADLSGNPLRDLLRFALSYALYLDRRTGRNRPVTGHPHLRAGTWGAGIRYAADGEGWFPRLFRDFVSNGLQRLGLSPTRWREAVILGLVDVAQSADHPEFARHHLRLAVDIAAGATQPRPPR